MSGIGKSAVARELSRIAEGSGHFTTGVCSLEVCSSSSRDKADMSTALISILIQLASARDCPLLSRNNPAHSRVTENLSFLQIGAHISRHDVELLRQKMLRTLLGPIAETMMRDRGHTECLKLAIAKPRFFLVVDDVWPGNKEHQRKGHLEELFGGEFSGILRTGGFHMLAYAYSAVLSAKQASPHLSSCAQFE